MNADGTNYTYSYDSKGSPVSSVFIGSGDAVAGNTCYIRQKTLEEKPPIPMTVQETSPPSPTPPQGPVHIPTLTAGL